MTTRAVTFNGATYLGNTTLGGLSDFSSSLPAGIISYWYKASTPLDVTMMLAYNDIQGHCLRLVHYIRGSGSNIYPMLQLQRPQAPAGTNAVFFSGNQLPYDGDWHHVIWGWDTSANPPVAKAKIDGSALTVINTTMPRASFSIDYSIANDWRIGGEYASSPLGTYEGDLAEVYLQCLNNYIDPDANLGVSIAPWRSVRTAVAHSV